MNPAESAGWFDECFAAVPVMVILRGFDAADALAQSRRAWALGLPLVEIPVQSERDLGVLAELAAEGRRTDHLVGAGTVTSVELLDRVVEAGARFTVAPGMDEEVARASASADCPHLPGVATATEVHRAHRLGLRWQKAFPAGPLGPGWVAAMRGPFPEVRFVATGGVDTANAAQFLDAGAGAVSLGSSFATSPDEAIRVLAARSSAGRGFSP